MNPFQFICVLVLLMFEKIFCEIDYRDILANISTTTKKQLSPQCRQNLNSASTRELLSEFSSSIFLEMGDYDRCLQIEEVETKFCQSFLVFGDNSNQSIQTQQQITPKLPKTSSLIKRSLYYCAFQSCSAHDLIIIFNGSVHFDDELCSSGGQDLDALAITAIVIFAIIGLVTAVSTFYDIYLVSSGSIPIHPTAIAFSLYTNGKKLFYAGSSQQLRCLNGIKSLSMLWVVLAHGYGYYLLVNTNNDYVAAAKWLDSTYSQYVNATFSIDTFLIIGGFLTIYTFQVTMDKGAKCNVPLYYFHRYWRLTPALAAMVLAHAALFKFFGSGPMWQMIDLSLAKPCQKYWWSVLLYVQNYANPTKHCVPQSWYLCVDMQLFLISPLILVIIRRWPRWGYSCLTIVSLLSVIGIFFIGWFYRITGHFSGSAGSNQSYYYNYYFFPTHTRMLPYLFGIILGHAIYRLKRSQKNLQINVVFVLLGWFLSLSLMAICIFGEIPLLKTEYNRLANSFYFALLRPTWTIAACWVIFACLMGYGGPVNKILSLSVFQITSKLCYSVYLVHQPFLSLTNFSIRSPLHFSDYYAFHKCLGDMMISMGIAVVYSLVFESPFIVLEKVLLGR